MAAPHNFTLAEAANALVDDEDAQALFRQFRGVLELKRRSIPVSLTGRPAVLNALLELAIEDESGFERVVDLVERRRMDKGLPRLSSVDEGRQAYMREFMGIKRERQARLIELLNELRSVNDKIKGSVRLELERVHAARWLAEKHSRENAARSRLGRRLSAEERKSIADQLWADVDAELDALEEFVKVQMRLPLHARSSTGFQFKLGVQKPK